MRKKEEGGGGGGGGGGGWEGGVTLKESTYRRYRGGERNCGLAVHEAANKAGIKMCIKRHSYK